MHKKTRTHRRAPRHSCRWHTRSGEPTTRPLRGGRRLRRRCRYRSVYCSVCVCVCVSSLFRTPDSPSSAPVTNIRAHAGGGGGLLRRPAGPQQDVPRGGLHLLGEGGADVRPAAEGEGRGHRAPAGALVRDLLHYLLARGWQTDHLTFYMTTHTHTNACARSAQVRGDVHAVGDPRRLPRAAPRAWFPCLISGCMHARKP